MNHHWYTEILRDRLLPWETQTFGRNFVFVQDNAQPNTAYKTTAFPEQSYVEVMH